MIRSSRLRSLIPTPLKAMLREMSYVMVLSDFTSLVWNYRVNHRASSGRPMPRTVELRIRQLGNRPVTIRTHGTDARVVFDTFLHQFHVPPAGVVPAHGPSLLLDLGSNIGCTVAHLACLYPDATVVGVELDRENAALCRQNIEPWSGRCRLVEGAAWVEDGTLGYDRVEGNEAGFSVAAMPEGRVTGARTARAYSILTLLAHAGAGARTVDYVKMDVEGAERNILRTNTGWASRVKCIKVELHGDYTTADCIADLARLGFMASTDTNHANCVVGTRAR